MHKAQESVHAGVEKFERAVNADTECRHISLNLCTQIDEAGQLLRKMISDANPRFMHSVRELRAVALETHDLTTIMHTTADLISNKSGESSTLEKSSELIENVLVKLDENRHGINNDLDQIRDLVAQISNYRSINEAINTINSSFQAVRINILIQCSTLQTDEDIFQDVTDDIEMLSKTLREITEQIEQELFKTTCNLSTLEKKVSKNQNEVDQLAGKAKGVVQNVHDDIDQLLQVTKTMIVEASSRSKKMNLKFDEIVVNMQFHDSLSQRVDHIQQSFDDICTMCTPENGDVSPEHLGTTYLILDLQCRQLNQLIDNIRQIHDHINESFSAIGDEVKGLNSIFQNSEFRAAGQDHFLGNFIQSLLEALMQLCKQLSRIEVMTGEITATARDTRNVSGNLISLVEGVQEMRDQIRIQAVNTIIMATNLNEQGLTIQVLAKEISTLSDKTSELLDELNELQRNVNQKVNILCHDQQDIYAESNKEHEAMIKTIENSYRELERGVAAIPLQVVAATDHIKTVQSDLNFMQQLQDGLQGVMARIESARDLVSPWKNKTSGNAEEIEKLINRYTMQQERMIHMIDNEESGETRQNDEDIFF